MTAVYPISAYLPLAQVSIQVDSSQPIEFFAFNGTDILSPSMATIFSSVPLSPGTHTLTMELINAGNLTLNSFSVYSSSTLSKVENSTITGTSRHDRPSPPQPSSSASGHSRAHTSLLIGTIIAAISLCIVSIFMTYKFMLCYRRRKLKKLAKKHQIILSGDRSSVASYPQPLTNIASSIVATESASYFVELYACIFESRLK